MAMRPRPSFPLPRVLAVDVDGTLIDGWRTNPSIVELVRQQASAGWDVVIWSMRGRLYAERAAALAGVSDLAICIGKPGYIIDDQGLDWLRGARVQRKPPTAKR